MTYNNTPTIVSAKGGTTVVAHGGTSTGITQLHQDTGLSATSGSLWTNTATAPTYTDAGYNNYTWAGWYRYDGSNYALVSDLSTVNAGSAPADGGAYVLYGLWTRTPETYTITYNMDGGTNASSNPSSYTIESSTITLADPTKSGYTFLGWTGTNGTTPQKKPNVTIAKGSTGNKTYTANWQKATYTVKFVDSDGKTALATADGTSHDYKPTDTTVAVPSSNKTGYTFSGWTLPAHDAYAAGTSTATGGLESWRGTAADTYTLKANWTPVTYTINWNATWGNSESSKDVSATSSLAYNSTTTIANSKPSALSAYVAGYTKDGYKLSGWYLTKGGTVWTGSTAGSALGTETIKTVVDGKASGTAPYNGAYLSGTTLNLYAVWTKLSSFTMTYHQNTDGRGAGTTADGTTSVTQGDKYTVGSDAPNSVRTRTGYTLTGWNSQADGKGTSYTDGQQLTNVQGAKDFYAQWKANTYKVTFNSNNGTGTMADESMTYDQTKALTTNTFSKTGYTFNGWNTKAGGDGTAYTDGQSVSNLTSTDGDTVNLYAQWKEILYTVKYNNNVTDTSVTFTKTDGTGTVGSPYERLKDGKSANWSGTDTWAGAGSTAGFGPDITATRTWYNFKHWSTTADDSTGAVDTSKNLKGLTASGTYTLDLYAIWDPQTVTVNYITDGHGTVDGATSKTGSVTVSEKVNLATGASTKTVSSATTTASAPQGATAAATATDTAAGYVLKNPVWTDETGATVTSSVGTAADATIAPTLAQLRTLATAKSVVDGALTFRANFELGTFNYSVEAYLQKADGTYESTAWQTLSQTQVPAFKATFGDTVNADIDAVTFNGTSTLIKNIPLTLTTNGQTASALYEYDGDKNKADGRESLTVSTTGNVLKLYFKRLTYDLYAYFQTKDAKGGNPANGSPASVTGLGTPASYASVTESGHAVSPADTNHALTGLRWGQSVTLGTPSHTGYTFAWAATDPTRTGNLSGAFSLTAAEMAALSSKTAKVTGTFTVITYDITLKDTQTDSPHTWSSDTAGNALSSGSYTATTKVASDQSLGSWVPTASDTDTYYFIGWQEDGSSSKPLTQAQLVAKKSWTGGVTYIAKWGKKVVIVYNVGASDSYGNPIADGWATSSVSLGDGNVGSDKYVGTGAPTGPASFQTVTGQNLVNGNPKAKAGWSFDGWKVSGTNGADSTKKYAQADIDTTGSSSSFALNANYSYTFTAQWKPDAATVKFSSTGTVSNNTGAGTYTITGVSIPNTNTDGTPNPAWVAGATSGTTTFHVDDKVDLTKYKPTNPAGYTFAGWTDGTNTYTTTDTATRGILTTGGLTLTPLFTENYVTFTYTAGTGGSVTGTAADKVFAVKHNTITPHTASPSTSTGYQFDKWTCAVGTAAATDVTTATAGTLVESDMGIGASDVLTDNRTYTANFKLRDIDIVFKATGSDGTTNMGTVTTPGSTIHTVPVKYGSKIPAGSVTVTEPYGYKLVGWDWSDGTNSGTVTGTATDTQGIFAKAWTSTANTITVTAKFAVDNTGKYTVKYDYDPAKTLGTSGYSGDASRIKVAWGASGDAILPASNPSTNPPSKAGYDFRGWYTDSNLTQAVNGYTFGEIYNGAKGATPITSTGTGLDGSNLPYITLYAKWEAPDFTVYYDTYGKDVNGNSLAKGSSVWATTVSPDTISSKTVKWAETNIAPTTNPTRGGYTFKGWTVEGTKGGSTAETLGWTARTDTGNTGKFGVQPTDSYGLLAGNDAGYTSIKLIARWEADACDVVYDYNDEGTRSNNIVSRKWDESVNYYNDPTTGAAPTRTGHSFTGWTYTYVSAADGTKTSGTVANSATTLAALRGGDADTHSIVDANGKPLYLTLTASWSTDKTYEFVDVLVPVGVSKADAAKDSNNLKKHRGTYTLTGGATSVSLATDYVAAFAGATTAYQGNGYDYDSAWAAANDKQSVLDDSKLNVVYVYFNERAYQIDYYGSEADSNDATASALASTSSNPWSSAKVTLPASSAEPSKEGYTFDGWYTKAGSTEVNLGKSVTGAAAKLEDVFGAGNAPATTGAVKAYAKFSPVTATITWAADAHGSVSPTTSPATRNADDVTNAVAAITATPDTNYVLVGWHYSYTDYAGANHEGDLTTTGADWATLSNAGANGNCLTLTPQPWKMTSTGSALWHTITFTAKFAASDAITVKVHHLYQDVNATGDAQWAGSTNTTNTYTGTADGVVAGNDFDAEPKARSKTGYTLVTDPTAVTAATGKPFGLKKKIDPDDATTLEFWLYYTANDQNLTYQFVDGSGNVVSVGSSSVPSTATLPTGGTYKTGKTITVPASEDKTGAVTGWTFDGWHVGTLSGTTYTKGTLVNDSATTASYTMPGSALVLVGTWSRVTHNVQFTQQGSSEDAAVAAGSQVTSNPGTLTVNDGEAVKQATNATNPNSKGAADAWDLSDLTVTAAPATDYYLAGWYVYQDLGSGYVPVDASGNQVSDKENSLVGASDPLARTISHDTKFIAKWAHSFVVTYAPGAHNASSFVAKVYHSLKKDAILATDAPAPTSTPAKNGWEFVGWGIQEGSTWNYLFDYDSAVDYGATVSDYGTTHRTFTSDYAMVTKDMTFTAFYKALDRTLRYHLTEADGSEAGKAYSPTAAFNGTTDTTFDTKAKTGEKPALKGDYNTTNATGDVTRTNYSLSGWKVMYNGTLYPTVYTSGTFQIPEVADGTVIHLYPVFTANDLDIYYTVAEPGKTGVWGTLDNSHEKVAAGSVAGSTPTAKPGYEFVQWRLDGSTTAISDGTYNATTHKLTPTASGTYVAVFKQKDYKFATEKGIVETATDTVTMPTGTQVSDTQTTPIHWTDKLGLTAYGEPTRAGYTFKGWDIYAKGDWDTTTATAAAGKTAIHTGLKGDQLVSALSDSNGDATDLVLVATWTKNNNYQVTFLTNDGTAGDGTTKVDAGTMPDDAPVSPATLAWGDSVTTLKAGKNPTRKGYTFKGWTVLESDQATVVGSTGTTPLTAGSYDFKGLADNKDTAARKHLYLKANWDANNYQVTFEAGTAGTNATNMPANAPVAPATTLGWGDSVTTLKGGTNPTWANSGYEFKGWTVYADAAHTTVVNSTDQAANYLKGSSYAYSTLANGDDSLNHLYLVANWDKATLGVEYHLDGKGTWVADGSKYPSGDPMNPAYNAGNVEAKFDAKVGDTINLRNGDTATYAGHNLLGWSVTKGATAPDADYDLSKHTSFTMPGTSVVLYAVWGEKTGYAVSFERNDTTTEPATTSTIPNGVSNLKWEDLVSVLTAAGTKPARAGYTFGGWDVYDSDGWDATAHAAKAGQSAFAAAYDADGSIFQVAFKTLAALTDTVARAHLYLVAKWNQINTYVVEFDGNGGSATVGNMPTNPQSGLTWGASVDLQAKDGSNTYSVPTLAGKTFKGWEIYTDAAHTAANKLGEKTAADTTDTFSALANSKTANAHLYLLAKWEDTKGYEVTFEANDSTAEPVTTGTMPADVAASANLKFGDTVATKVVSGATTTIEPKRPGYTFLGWTAYSDASHTTVIGATDTNHLTADSYAYSALTAGADLAHVRLVANWQDKGSNYKVTYDANDSDGATKATGVPTTWTGKFNGTGVKLDEPSRKGYTFQYWESSVAGAHVTATSTATTYDKLAGQDTVTSVTLKAIWKADEVYNVVYNDGGAGSDLTSTLPSGRTGIKFDANDVKMDAQTRKGFTFTGWQAYNTTTESDLKKAPKLGSVIKTYTDAVYSTLAAGDDAVKTITLVAQWEGKKHDLTYDKNDTNAVWSTTASYYPTGDPVANGTYNTSEQGRAISVAYGATVNLRSASTLTLTGKTLIGWQTKDGATKYYLSDAPAGETTVTGFSMPDNDLTLVPIWKESTGYSVTFLDRPTSDKGTDAVTNMPVSPQSNLAWSGNVDLQAKDGSGFKGAPVRVGYTFQGWEIQDSKGNTLGSTAATDTNDAYNDLADNKDIADRKSLVLVARWTASTDYNVTFVANDGTAGDGTTKVTKGTMPTDRKGIAYATTGIDVSDPTRPGYTFKGWKSSVAGADVAAGTSTADYATLADNKDVHTVTLTAQWDADETYSVTYNDGVPSGETGLDAATPLPDKRTNIGYDANDVKVTELKRSGYTFQGWDVYETANMNNWLGDVTSAYTTDRVYSALAGSAAVKGITLVAKWEAVTSKVTYHLTSGQGTWSTDVSKYPAQDKGASKPADPTGYKTGEKVYLRGGATIDRPGYTLRGWSKTAPADPLKATPDYDTTISYFTMPVDDVDLYPVWTAVKYRVTFKDKDDSDKDSANAVAGLPDNLPSITYDASVAAGSATDPKAPTRPGYDFAGWVVTDDNNANAVLNGTDTTHVGAGTYTYQQLAKDPSIKAITLTAQWTKHQYEVRYYNINSTGTAEPLWTGTATDGGVLRADGSVAVAYYTGDPVSLRDAGTARWAGHTLKGWATGTDKTAAGYTEYLFDASGKAGFSMPADNVYLYPVWDEAKDYAVKYVANQPSVADGAVAGKSVTGMPTDKSGLSWTTLVSTAHPTFAGFKFLGWVVTGIDKQVAGGYGQNNPYTGSDAYFNVLAGNEDTAAHKTLTLTAKWVLDLVYNVIFKDGVASGETPVTAGTMPTDQTGIAYTARVDHHAPTRAGYKFTGWTVEDVTDPSNTHSLDDRKGGTTSYYVLTGTPDFPSYTKLQMTANWQKRNDYNVHFVAGDGTTGDGLTKVTAGTMPADALGISWDDWFGAAAPTREGYTFLGWDVKNTTNGASDQISDPKTPATAGKYQYSKTAYNVTAKKYDDTYTDLTFTALWKALSHTVTYVISGNTDASWVKANITDKGKNNPDSALSHSVDDTVTLRGETTVARNGWILSGWANGTDSTASGYKEYVFANGDTAFTMPNADVKLYPLWTGKSYQVTYDANTGSLTLTDPSQVVSGLHDPNPMTGLSWTSDVPVDPLTMPGYKFLGWVVKDAKETGALTGTLTKNAYTYDELAKTDTAAHVALTLVAQWEQAVYRLIYVDPVDANGAALATPVQIGNDAAKHWGDTVDATTNPIAGTTPWYTGKTEADWQFDGWQVYDAAAKDYVTLTADQLYSYLAGRENLTLADVATATDDPAVILYASWTRRVPFVVDFVKRPAAGTEVVESSTTLTGLDGDDITTTMVNGKTWADTVLDLGDGHTITGYAYNRMGSTPGMMGILVAGGDELHLKLFYDPLTDYLVTYDATPGQNADGNAVANAASPSWETSDASFAPVDSDWYYQGHKIDHWYYKGADGIEHTFDPTDGKTFADIAAIIYGTVDGTEGRDADGDGVVDGKPVTLYAAWVERDDYKVKYNDNYDPSYDNDVEDKFLGRVKDATYTPADRQDVAWSSTAIQPTDTTDTIKEPGVTGGMALYEQDGWNYSTDGGLTQHPAEGMTFAQIAQAVYGTSEPDAGTITLYARWKQVDIKLTYTPVIATVDADGKFQTVTGTMAGGTVSRASETVSAITGGTVSGSDLKAAGATATASRGYHFIGWRRVSDGTVVYAPGYDPTAHAKSASFSAMSAMSLTAASTGTGFNVLPDGTIDASTIFSVAQNVSDGYWHGEDYQALFVENDPAVLHYDKNADDATGTIADVTKPYGTLITLDSGTEDATADTTDGFKRDHWKLTGWNTKADGTGTAYALSQADWEMPQGETTLYAMWEKVMGRLIYDKNATDATGTIADVVKQGGTVITLDSGTEDTTADTTDGFHRAHYTLVGWNTKADYSGTHYDLSEAGYVMPDGTTTLYAEWQINKYEISGPEGTKVTIPEGGTGTTTGGTTGGTTGTKIDGGYVTGGDVTKIEYGQPIPSGWIEAIPETGKHVDHWTYTWTDEDGTVHTETADDPTKFTVKGNGTITPVFVDDPVEEPETPAATPSTTTAAAHTSARAAGETIPQTSDVFDAALPLAAAGLGLLLILVAFVTRHRDDEEEEA